MAANEKNSWIYSGLFDEGQRHGNGRCEWPQRGVWYDGEWRDGLQLWTSEGQAPVFLRSVAIKGVVKSRHGRVATMSA